MARYKLKYNCLKINQYTDLSVVLHLYTSPTNKRIDNMSNTEMVAYFQ